MADVEVLVVSLEIVVFLVAVEVSLLEVHVDFGVLPAVAILLPEIYSAVEVALVKAWVLVVLWCSELVG